MYIYMYTYIDHLTLSTFLGSLSGKGMRVTFTLATFFKAQTAGGEG